MTKKIRINKNFKRIIQFIANSRLPYIIKVSLLFFIELIFNWIHIPKFFNYKKIKNKTILITGGTGNICNELIKELQKDNKLLIITRKLIPSTNNIKYIQMNLEDISNSKILNKLKNKTIDILICCAGVLDSKILYRNFSINYISHKILSKELNIKKILLVSSCVSLSVNVRSNINLKYYNRWEMWYGKSYAESKYLLFFLADKLSKNNIDVVLVHPGIINTSLFNNKFNFIEKILKMFIRNFGLSKKRGAHNIMNSLMYLNENKISGIQFWYLDCLLEMHYENFKWEVL